MMPFSLMLLAVVPGARVPACVPVDGDRILMRDLARTLPPFKALDPNQPVGFAPLPGARRVFLPKELTAMARVSGITLEGAVSVCFERATAMLAPSQLETAIRHSVGDGVHFEITDFSRYPVPPGELQFSKSGLNYPPAGSAGTP